MAYGNESGLVTCDLTSDLLRMAYGNESGLVIVDTVQRTCLLNLGTPDLYGPADPYQRAPRSPKQRPEDDLGRSPDSEQVSGHSWRA